MARSDQRDKQTLDDLDQGWEADAAEPEADAIREIDAEWDALPPPSLGSPPVQGPVVAERVRPVPSAPEAPHRPRPIVKSAPAESAKQARRKMARKAREQARKTRAERARQKQAEKQARRASEANGRGDARVKSGEANGRGDARVKSDERRRVKASTARADPAASRAAKPKQAKAKSSVQARSAPNPRPDAGATLGVRSERAAPRKRSKLLPVVVALLLLGLVAALFLAR